MRPRSIAANKMYYALAGSQQRRLHVPTKLIGNTSEAAPVHEKAIVFAIFRFHDAHRLAPLFRASSRFDQRRAAAVSRLSRDTPYRTTTMRQHYCERRNVLSCSSSIHDTREYLLVCSSPPLDTKLGEIVALCLTSEFAWKFLRVERTASARAGGVLTGGGDEGRTLSQGRRPSC